MPSFKQIHDDTKLAVENNDWEKVTEIARQNKADIDDSAGYGRALLRALEVGEINAAFALLETGASVKEVNAKTQNGCVHAVILQDRFADQDKVALINLLLQHNADLTKHNKNNVTPIRLAGEKKKWDIVRAIASQKKTDVDDDACYGIALHAAAQSGENEVVRELIAAGAPLDWQDDNAGNFYLHEAVRQDSAESVKLLLEHNANINDVNDEGLTPIALAAKNGKWSIVDIFLQDALSKHKTLNQAGIVFAYAIKAGQLDIARMIIRSNLASPQVVAASMLEGKSPLDWALAQNNVEAIQFLVGNHLFYYNDLPNELDDIDVLMTLTTELYSVLPDKDIVFEGQKKIIQKIMDYQAQVVALDLKNLHMQRTDLRISSRRSGMDKQRDAIDFVIEQASHYGEVGYQRSSRDQTRLQLLSGDFPAAAHLLQFEVRQHQISVFTNHVKNKLLELKMHAEQIQWQRKKLVIGWVRQQPKVVADLLKELKDLSGVNTDDKILQICERVMAVLSKSVAKVNNTRPSLSQVCWIFQVR